MSDNIYKKMVYSRGIPMWHNITPPSEVDMTATQVLNEKFNGGFPVILRPVYVELNGEQVETGDFAIVRGKGRDGSPEVKFGFCSQHYLPLQPVDVAKTFDENVQEFAETMAFLGDGNDMFISWKMPSYEVISGDEIQMYGIVRTGFDTLKGTRLYTSVYRPVCQNTITLAQNWAKANTDGHGKGEIWKGKGTNKNLLRDLGYWMAHVQSNALRETELLKSFFGNLAKTPIKSEQQAKGILVNAYPNRDDISSYYPSQLREDKQESIESFNESQQEIRDSIYGLFAGAGTAITPDYWGMLNSTSEYFCHYQPSKKPIAESVMFGNRQRNIMRMVEVLAR